MNKDKSHLVVFGTEQNFFDEPELYQCMIMSEENIIGLLLECTLFQGMSYEEISRVLTGNTGRVKSYSRDLLIAQAGDKVRSLHILLQESEKVLLNFINIVSSRGQFLSNKIKFLSFTNIKGKLAQYLLDLSGQAGSNSFMLPHSQSQLSELFGVARPSIGRAIGELNRDGIFRTEGKRVVILDHSGLTSYLK